MIEYLQKLLNEPVYVKILIGLLGVVIILGLTQLIQRALTKSIVKCSLYYRFCFHGSFPNIQKCVNGAFQSLKSGIRPSPLSQGDIYQVYQK